MWLNFYKFLEYFLLNFEFIKFYARIRTKTTAEHSGAKIKNKLKRKENHSIKSANYRYLLIVLSIKSKKTPTTSPIAHCLPNDSVLPLYTFSSLKI